MLLIFLDLMVYEVVAIFISTVILKQVGKHPMAWGRMRNYVIKFGPRAIRTAVVSYGEKPKEKKTKKVPAPKERQVRREKPRVRNIDK